MGALSSVQAGWMVGYGEVTDTVSMGRVCHCLFLGDDEARGWTVICRFGREN